MDSAGSSKAEEVAAYQSSEVKQARLQSMLAALLDDPILADVPRKPSLGDVDTLINLELGSAMRVTVVKLDSSSFDVAVLNTATVKDLKLAIRKKITEIEQGQMGHRHISWKHIWENYCLTHQSEKLIDDNSVLPSHDIRNNSKEIVIPPRDFGEREALKASDRALSMNNLSQEVIGLLQKTKVTPSSRYGIETGT